MIPSRAMACRRRGAPVKLWSPAPQVEKKEPNTMTQGEGHANVPMTRLPFTPSPNLRITKWYNIFTNTDLIYIICFIRTEQKPNYSNWIRPHVTEPEKRIKSEKWTDSLVSQDHSLHTGTKQDHRGHVWETQSSGDNKLTFYGYNSLFLHQIKRIYFTDVPCLLVLHVWKWTAVRWVW